MDANAHKILQKVALFVCLFMFIVGCGLPNSLRQPTIEDTLGSLATQLSENNLLGTVQAAATEPPDIDLLATASSIIKPEEAQLLATVEAFSAQKGKEVVGTLEAYTSINKVQIESTVQALLQDEKVPATMEAYLEKLKEPFSEEIPEDIPIVKSEKINKLFKTPRLITYSTSLSYDEVVTFYKTYMPRMGWKKIERGTTELDSVSVLKYTKYNQEASVSIYKNIMGKSVIVLISISVIK